MNIWLRGVQCALGSCCRSQNSRIRCLTTRSDKDIDELLSGIGRSRPRKDARDEQIKSTESLSRAGGFARSMNFPGDAAQTGRSVAQALMNYKTVVPPKRRTIRSRPTVGRTVELDPDRGVDFGRALRQVNILCSTNRVRREAAQQRFHERPGLKRKRLKRDRWRVLFMKGFKATVGRVKEMRRKGW